MVLHAFVVIEAVDAHQTLGVVQLGSEHSQSIQQSFQVGIGIVPNAEISPFFIATVGSITPNHSYNADRCSTVCADQRGIEPPPAICQRRQK